MPLGNEEELRKQCTFYRSGLLGLVQGPLPTEDYWISCPHYVHVLFVGAVMSPRYSEMLDWVIGWTGLLDDGSEYQAMQLPATPPPIGAGQPVPPKVAPK